MSKVMIALYGVLAVLATVVVIVTPTLPMAAAAYGFVAFFVGAQYLLDRVGHGTAEAQLTAAIHENPVGWQTIEV